MTDEDRITTAEAAIRNVETSLAVLESRVTELDKHLAERAGEAMQDRRSLHDKIDSLLTMVHQRVGGDKVRSAISYAFYGGAGTALGWMLKMTAG